METYRSHSYISCTFDGPLLYALSDRNKTRQCGESSFRRPYDPYFPFSHGQVLQFLNPVSKVQDLCEMLVMYSSCIFVGTLSNILPVWDAVWWRSANARLWQVWGLVPLQLCGIEESKTRRGWQWCGTKGLCLPSLLPQGNLLTTHDAMTPQESLCKISWLISSFSRERI